jgi:septal ring factor EnvC (AmiA/AmiB activator)
MSVSAIGSMSGTNSVNSAATELQKAQQKLASDLAAKAAATKVLAEDRDAVARAQQATQAAQAAEAARRAAEQQALPVARTPQEKSKPVTASAGALGSSFDVRV